MVTALVGENTAAVIEDDGPSFEWSAVLAGAAIAAGATFFLVLVGAALGLSLAGTRNATGAHSFLTIGAIYFLAAEMFGFALGGYVTGRMMRPEPESTDEHFRADVHGLAVWSLAIVAGLMFAGLAGVAGLSQAAPATSQPMAYWADRLLVGASFDNYAARNDVMARMLAADMVQTSPINPDHDGLVRMISAQNGVSPVTAGDRLSTIEDAIRAQTDAARHALLYLTLWTVVALLLGGIVAITATVMARFHDEDFSFKNFRNRR